MTTKLFLIRGTPGQGKSSLAREIASHIQDSVHLETDMYFINEAGEYKWDGMKIREAHEWCLNETRRVLESGRIAIVSNTFTKESELIQYFELAKELDSKVFVMTSNGSFKNIHDVPENVLVNMKNRFKHDISGCWNILTGNR